MMIEIGSIMMSAPTPVPPSIEQEIASRAPTRRKDTIALIFTISALLIILGGLICFRTFVFRPYRVPSTSMEPTLLVGDQFMANLTAYLYDKPERGEIIIFKFPLNTKQDFVKRVIAVEGETLEMVDGKLFIDGQPQEEPYAHYSVDATIAPVPPRSFGPVKVPKGSLFVMGDNRDRCNDSRSWGYVPLENVVGRAAFIYWSENQENVRLGRVGQAL